MDAAQFPVPTCQDIDPEKHSIYVMVIHDLREEEMKILITTTTGIF